MSDPHTAKNSDSAWLADPLERLTAITVRRARTVLVLTVIVTLVSVVATIRGLGFRGSRLDLLNPRSEFNQRWLAHLEAFEHDDDVIVVVHGETPSQIRNAVDMIADRVAAAPNKFRNLFYRVDLSPLRHKGLYYLGQPELDHIRQFVTASEPLLRGNYQPYLLPHQLTGWTQAIAQQARRKSSDWSGLLGGLQLDLDTLQVQLNGEGSYALPADPLAQGLRELDRLGTRYLEGGDGRYAYLLFRLPASSDSTELARGKGAIRHLRTILESARSRFPELEFGLTGLPVMEFDEMQTSQTDMMLSAIVSLISVAVVFMIGFGTLWHPALAVFTLVIAMAWSFAGATGFVGHLNILSVSFSVILIGLGIDFGIHYLARYSQLRATGADADTALPLVARSVGPAIVAGGLTTALAFGAASFTEFTGVAELGVIAGQGIVWCVVAALVVFPALLAWFDRGHRVRVCEPMPVDRWLAPLMARPQHAVVGMLLGTGLLAVGIPRLWYDHNLLNLQATGLESVVWEHRLLEHTDSSAWYAISISDDPRELLARQRQFEALPSVQRTEEIVSLLPHAAESKRGLVADLSRTLESVPQEVPLMPVAPREAVLDQLQALMRQCLPVPAMAPLLDPLRRVQRQLHGLSNAAYFQRMTAYQQDSLERDMRRLQMLKAVAHADPPEWNDVPASLRNRFLGKGGVHLLKVYAKANIWDMQALEAFVTDVERVDGQATGQPIQTFYASRQMQSSYVQAAGYSLLAVTLVLCLDFRKLRDALLAMMPVMFGLAQLLGIMGWLDMPLNPANMIVLPLILGIGIDDGVHIMHDFRARGGPYRVSRSTGAAIVITSLTTMAGFGSLMLARHQGLQSLGRVLTLGVACCLVSSLVFLPALLSWVSPHGQVRRPGDAGPTEWAGNKELEQVPSPGTDAA